MATDAKEKQNQIMKMTSQPNRVTQSDYRFVPGFADACASGTVWLG